MSIKSAWKIIKETFSEFGEDKVLRLSAALAYYAIFSIGPLLAIIIGLVGLAFGSEHVREQIHQQLQGMLGENSAKTIDSMIAARSRGTSLLTTILGAVALIVGASGVFGQLQDSLNTIWEVKAKPGAGIWVLVRDRFLSFSMVLGIGFLLLVSLALSTALGAVTKSMGQMLPMGEGLAHLLDWAVSFGVITLLFAMIFKFLPDVKVPWSKVWVGAAGTALLFTLGKYLLGLYLGRESTSSAYGAAGSVIVILMWVYYASVILFFGAEFTQVYAKFTGAKIRASEYAVRVTEEDRAQQGMATAGTSKHRRNDPIGSPVEASESDLASAHAPGRVLRDNAFEFASLLFAAGLLAGTLLRFKSLRYAAKLYSKLK